LNEILSGIHLRKKGEDCLTFQGLTPSPSSGCAGGLVVPKRMTKCPNVVVSFGSSKPMAHTEDGYGVGSRNV